MGSSKIPLSLVSVSSFVSHNPQRDIFNLKPKGVTSSCCRLWYTNGIMSHQYQKLTLSEKTPPDTPPFDFHYRLKNIENHKDSRDCVHIHLIHIQKLHQLPFLPECWPKSWGLPQSAVKFPRRSLNAAWLCAPRKAPWQCPGPRCISFTSEKHTKDEEDQADRRERG